MVISFLIEEGGKKKRIGSRTVAPALSLTQKYRLADICAAGPKNFAFRPARPVHRVGRPEGETKVGWAGSVGAPLLLHHEALNDHLIIQGDAERVEAVGEGA